MKILDKDYQATLATKALKEALKSMKAGDFQNAEAFAHDATLALTTIAEIQEKSEAKGD
jgi:uncharacterized protein HemY